MQEDSILGLLECRRVIEPQVTALAATRSDVRQQWEIDSHLRLMREATVYEELVDIRCFDGSYLGSALAHAEASATSATL